jgi:hypothetical protein
VFSSYSIGNIKQMIIARSIVRLREYVYVCNRPERSWENSQPNFYLQFKNKLSHALVALKNTNLDIFQVRLDYHMKVHVFILAEEKKSLLYDEVNHRTLSGSEFSYQATLYIRITAMKPKRILLNNNRCHRQSRWTKYWWKRP